MEIKVVAGRIPRTTHFAMGLTAANPSCALKSRPVTTR